jgi:two-component system, cell cycle response regulator
MPERILVIDDAAAIHRLLAVHLADEHVTLHAAYSGDLGMKAAQELQPDLILLDVDMPELNGYEVCARLKAHPQTAHIPVLFLTGSCSTDEKVRGLELGAVDYVTKPFEPGELRARVRAALRTKRLTDLLAQKAQLDGLTALWNRAYLESRLAQEASRQTRSPQPIACVMLDVDHFKSINDRFGHPAGDEVLRAISRTLSAQTRLEDCVCRYGGEEFAILTPGIDADGAMALAERIRCSIADMNITQSGVRIQVTASLGVSGGPEIETLVARADEALYCAKHEGRNRVVLAKVRCKRGGERAKAMNTASVAGRDTGNES